MSPLEHLPRYLLSFFAALALSALLTPVMGRLATRLGILDHPRQGRFHQRATPYLGGLAVGGALVLVAAATKGLSGKEYTILLCGVAICVLGFLDDRGRVGPVIKLLVEGSAGLALWLAGIRAGLFGIAGLDLLLTITWVIVVTNALNLIDNMDGLASGLAALCALGFFGISAMEGHYLVASLAVAICGASLGFLAYNFPPAKIFLGDAGALLLGFLLAATGLELDLMNSSSVVRAALPLLVLAVPLFDMVVVVTLRLMERRPIYVGGTDHTSHRLAQLGASPREVAFAAFGLQAACCTLAVALFSSSSLALVVGVTAFAAVAAIGWGVVVHDRRRLGTVLATGAATRMVAEPTGIEPVHANEDARE